MPLFTVLQAEKIGSSPLKGCGDNCRPGGKYWQPTAWFMTHVTCRLTAKYRDQLRNPMLGNRICVLPLPFRTVVGRQQLHATARHSTQIPLADRPHLLQQLRGLRLRGVAVTGVSRFYRLHRPNRRYLLSAVGRRNHKDRRRDAVRTEKPHSSVQRHRIYSRTTTDSIGFCVVNGSALLILLNS